MVQLRSIFPISIALLTAVLYFFFKPDDTQFQPEQIIQLPDDSPDIYMTDVDITRYNAEGIATLHAKGESIAIYDDRQLSQFNQPIIHLIEQGTRTWKITADMAFLNENNLIEFHNNVIATHITSPPALILETEFLSVNNSRQTINTDLPVQLTKGNQRVNAIGMDAKMDTMGSIIHFQSEVSFIYEP